MKKDVLFIHPANHKRTYQDLAGEFTAIAPPVWTVLSADFVRRQGYEATIYDTNIEGWSPSKASELLQDNNPELVVLLVYGNHPSASTQTMPAAVNIVADIKLANPDIPIALGGIHPAALPELTINETQADYIFRGEAATSLKLLLEVMKGKKDRSFLQGITYRTTAKQIVDTPPCQLIEDLDQHYPAYAWDLLPPLSYYRAHNSHTMQYFKDSNTEKFTDVRSPYAILYTSLGCPFNCSYCCANSIFGGQGIRFWSVEKIIDWIDDLVINHKVKHIRFDDELFISSPARIEHLCDILIERKYELNLWGYARLDTIKDHLLKKMKRAGINWLCLGIESADMEILKGVRKRLNRDVISVVEKIQQNGIFVLGNFMFGLPGDTMLSMEATYALAKKINCEFINFYCTMPYPGSELYTDWLTADSSALPDSWEGYSQHGYTAKPLPTAYLSAKEILKFRDDAFNDYFTDKTFLASIAEKFGHQAVEHISRMTSIRLQRKLLE